MLKVTIEKNEKTVRSPLEVELGKFTIFAGENNSGKTQLVDGLSKEIEKLGKNVIRIPAERVILENEISTSSAKDPLRERLSELVDLKLKDGDFEVENGIDDIEKELPNIFNEYGIDSIELSAKKGTPEAKDYVKEIKDVYVKKALDSITIKDNKIKDNDAKEIQLKDAGQGTERLAIVAFLHYLSSKGVNPDEDVYLIIEEPEIYLHPKLKQTFFKALKKLNKESDVKVVITTHDPYFISLSDEVIYRVYRGESGLTEVKKMNNSKDRKLPYRSNSEINYLVFDLPTIEYGLQLYEKFIKGDKDKEKKMVAYGETQLVDIRNKIAHQDSPSPSEEQLKCFIEGIIANID